MSGAERKKEKLSFYIFGISFLLIVIAIIHYKPSPFLFIPLLVSAIIMLLQSRVNRYAFIVGAINAILYAIAYMKMSLHMRLCTSFPSVWWCHLTFVHKDGS